MTTSLLPNHAPARICKHLPELPPVVSDWQQSCLQPRCSYYCQGECCNPARRGAFSPCPLDGKELLLEDAEPAYADDRVEDNVWCETGDLPKKG